jgi:putative Mg2+ transporter-C (MgtC) family protein
MPHRAPPTTCATSTTREPRGREPAIHLFAVLAQEPSFIETVAAELHLDLALKLLVAVILGGAIGMEREFSGKPAGLRTNILICIGSALLMDLSIRVGLIGIAESGGGSGDPGRIAAQIVSGIGFLGAGTILQARGAVIGLTTAATIWVVAAIGMVVGAGHYIEAIGSAVLVTAVLTGLGRVERHLLNARRTVSGTIRVVPGTPFEEVVRILTMHGIQIQSKGIVDDADARTYELRLAGPAKQFDTVTGALMRREDVLSVQFD